MVILQREFRYQSLLEGVKALIQILRSIITTSPLDWMPVHRKITPQHLIWLPEQVIHLDSWVEGDTVTEKCFAQRTQNNDPARHQTSNLHLLTQSLALTNTSLLLPLPPSKLRFNFPILAHGQF